MDKTNKNCVCKLRARVSFPQGAAPGAGTSFNIQIVSRNGNEEPVLRGSALAGVLRSAYTEEQRRKLAHKDNDKDIKKIVDCWFGSKAEEDSINNSCIEIADMPIKCTSVSERTHNMINRHTGTGAASKDSLFSIETIAPGSQGMLSITIKQNKNTYEDYRGFVREIAEIIAQGLLIGGSSNRGIGQMKLEGDIIYEKSFDLNLLEDLSVFLDAQYIERKEKGFELAGIPLKLNENKNKNELEITLELGIPRGEDLVVGDGQEGDYILAPQYAVFADGSRRWRIPGSSFRGIIRNWMTRLAAREGGNVMDSVGNWLNIFNSDDDSAAAKYTKLTGWGFIDKKKDKNKWEQCKKYPCELEDPILDLFGSLYKRGRIHITDAYTPEVQEADKQELANQESDTQDRIHVAIDRFTGGANEGALFKNKVLTGENLRFPITIIIKNPKEKELKWLKKTLLALHLGILHVGSSKGGGRLEIKSISATGPESEIIKSLQQDIKELN